jgi:CheY-like chemotaxis protein
MGVGLKRVKDLVERGEGPIERGSIGPPAGVQFARRAGVEGDARRSMTFERGSLHGTSATSARVLIVDDNRDSAMSLSVLLQMLGHDTYTAYDGLSALEAADQFRPDVMLLDIGLPKMDGLQVARLISARPWGRRVKLVAMTGWGQDSDRRRSREAGFDHHLVKPLDMQELILLLGMRNEE